MLPFLGKPAKASGVHPGSGSSPRIRDRAGRYAYDYFVAAKNAIANVRTFTDVRSLEYPPWPSKQGRLPIQTVPDIALTVRVSTTIQSQRAETVMKPVTRPSSSSTA